MDIKDTCFNCQATRKELEESKQKHMLDFKTIKEKIVSTDKLIKLYQEKCQEFDKQTKHVAELATKLEGSQRNIDVIRLQLKKSLELSEPLQKTCHDLQKENQIRRNEMQKLQDKLRASENLVIQLKNAVKEKEKSADAFKLDMTIQEREIDGQKKRLKKNETLMTKLKEQVSEQKREKREVNKQLTLAQNRLKKMENQDEASKEMIAKLTDQLHQAKQASKGFDKVHNFIKSPSPPKRLQRTRSSCALEQQKDADELTETHLMDEINNLLYLSPCPSLSPLPPSPGLSRKDDDDIGSENAKFVNDDLDCIDGDDDYDGDDDSGGVGDGVGDGNNDDVGDGNSVGDGNGVGDGDSNADGVGDGDGDGLDDGNGDDVDDGGDDDDDYNICNQNYADIQLGDNMSQSENDESGFTISKVRPSQDDPLCTAGDDLTNTARQSDTKSLLDCETNQDRPEKVPSDEVICVTSNQSPFSMTLRSGRKRKRERLSTNLKVATDELNTSTEHGDIPNNRKHAKTENITEQRLFENQETKKSRNGSDNDVVDHVINCTETKSSETNLRDSCSAFKIDSLPMASESLVATPSKMSEGLRQEVSSACLKSIIDGVVVRESAAKDRAASFVNETNMQAEETTDHSEAYNHTKSINDFYEVSNCLNNVIEIVANSSDAPKSPLSNNVLTVSRRDVKENGETVVCESTEVCLKETSSTNIMETKKCMDLRVIDAKSTILDRKSDEMVGNSSLDCDLRRDGTVDQSETSNVGETTKCVDLRVVDAFNTTLDRKSEETVGSSPLVCDLRRDDDSMDQSTTTNVVETTKCVDLGIIDAVNTTLDSKSEETVGSSSLVGDLRRDDDSMDQSETVNVVETTKCMDLGAIDAMNTTLDRNSEETVGSSLVGDLRHDDSCMDQSETVTDSVQMRRETIKKSDSDPSCNSDESFARIRQEFSVNDTLEKPLVIPEDDITESCVNESLTFSPVVSAPLSPIPDSPERTREIPSFELWDNLPPLSPIPPSPKELALAWNHEITDDNNQAIKQEKPDVSQPKEIFNVLPENPEVHLIPTLPANPVSNNLHKCVKSSQMSVTVDSTDRENRETSSRTESNDKKTPLVSIDPLDRSSKVGEHKYVLRLLTMLKNNDITTEEVTRRFLIIANLRAATPFASALLHILKEAQDDEEHALMEKFAERHESGQTCDKVSQPIITDFEMRVAVVVHNLSKRKQFFGLLRCLRKLLGNTLCGFFRSEDNDSAVLAICRVYTVVCRLTRDIGRIRVFCYDIIKENRRHLLTQKIIGSVGLAWPGVLGTNDNSLQVFSDSVVLNGPPYQPLLSTLQVVIMAREALYDKTLVGIKPSRFVFRRLYGWAELPSGIATLEWLARDLVRTLRDSGYMTLEMKPDFGPSMGSGAFESVKSLELLAVVLGWEWTNDVLIRELLWPVLLEWWERDICRRDGVKESSTGLHVSRCPTKCEMESQKNDVGVCHTELKVMEVENNDESSAVIRNINSGLNVQNDIKVTDNRQMIEAEAVSGVSHANKVTLNGVRTKLEPISHSGPEISSQVPTTNDVDTDLKSLKTEEENTKAKSVSGCLPEVELKTASEMFFTNVNEKNSGLLNKDNTSSVVNVCLKIGERIESESMEVRGDAKGEHGLNVEKNNVEVTIVSILRLLGLLGLVGLQKDGVDLDAMVNLMCSILTCADEFEGVTFGIQLAAAYALIDMLMAKPMEIFKVLNNWITQVEDKTKEINLPPHFTRQIKYYRTHLFKRKS